jgi:hypothetical protein
MIINIPLQVDEAKMEEVIARDYQGKVADKIDEYIQNALASQSERYYGDRAQNGMLVLIKDKIDDYLKEHNDEIVKEAGTRLAEKLVRTKRGKELLEKAAEVSE